MTGNQTPGGKPRAKTWGRAVAAFPLLMGLLAPAVSSAGSPPFDPVMCPAERLGSNLGCVAKDVTFAGNPKALAIWNGATKTDILPGETVTCNEGDEIVMDLNVTITAQPNSRYDLGLFIGNQGQDIQKLAISGGNTSCSTYVFPQSGGHVTGGNEIPPVGFQEISNPKNACGDVNGSTGTSEATMSKVLVQCVKDPATGNLKLPMLITWNVDAKAACTGNTYPVPTSQSKCNASANTIVANVVPVGAVTPTLTLNKAPPTGILALGETLTYVITATNTGPSTQTNVVVSDTTLLSPGLQPSSTKTCATLASGDTCVLTGTYVVQSGDVTAGTINNTAWVQSDQVTTPVSDQQITPLSVNSLSLDKPAPTGELAVGETITYTITATNTGNTTQTGVVVSDTTLAGLSPNTITCPSVAPNETCVLVGNYVVKQSDVDKGLIDNTASVQSAQVTTPVEDSESTIIASNPLLNMVKTASPLTYSTAGTVINYSYVLKNVGDAVLSGPFTVTDDKIASVNCSGAPATLGLNESYTCTATYTTTQADVDAGSITNVASATAKDPQGYTVVSPIKRETVNSDAAPVLSLVKTGNPHTYSALASVITYSYLITNEGDLTLSGPFTVSDDKIANVNCGVSPPATLAPGGTLNCTGTYTITEADIFAGSVTNTASVVAKDPQGNVVTSPVAKETVSRQSVDLLTMIKTPTPQVFTKAGDIIEYNFALKNEGSVMLVGPFTVSDDKLGAVSCPTTNLAPGATLNCTKTYTITQADIDAGSVTNLATAQGKTPWGTAVVTPEEKATVTSDVKSLLGLVKTASSTTYSKEGDVINYTYVLTNNGGLTLSGPFKVEDNKARVSCDSPPATLAPGASLSCTASYTITQTDVDAGSVTNSAVAEAIGPNGLPVFSPRVQETVQSRQLQSLSLVKIAPVGKLKFGETITYTVVATNTGYTTQTDVVVSDTMLATSKTCPELAPGATCELTGSYVVQQTDVDAGKIVNTAQVVSAQVPAVTDTETTPIIEPSTLKVDKSQPVGKLVEGATITYTVTATNTGLTTQYDVVVADSKISPNSETCKEVRPGGTCVLTGTYVVQKSDVYAGSITNTGSATSDQVTTPVEDTVVTPLRPAPEPPKPIPTLNEWAQLIMALLMIALLGWHQRGLRRR